MDICGIDPRDTTWEQDHATYRVYFWDRSANCSDTYEIGGEADVEAVLAWAEEHAPERGGLYTLYAVTTDAGRRGLIRLAGVTGDPFD